MHPHLARTAIRALAGRQVAEVEDLYMLICGESLPAEMPPAIRTGLGELLRTLGYRQRWVRPVEGAGSGFKWVRDPWPIDVEALRGRELETYTNFD